LERKARFLRALARKNAPIGDLKKVNADALKERYLAIDGIAFLLDYS
jgi:hypothetical protein